jgi:hypothetical protein
MSTASKEPHAFQARLNLHPSGEYSFTLDSFPIAKQTAVVRWSVNTQKNAFHPKLIYEISQQSTVAGGEECSRGRLLLQQS